MNDHVITNIHLVMANVVLSSIMEKIVVNKIWDTLIKLYEIFL